MANELMQGASVGRGNSRTGKLFQEGNPFTSPQMLSQSSFQERSGGNSTEATGLNLKRMENKVREDYLAKLAGRIEKCRAEGVRVQNEAYQLTVSNDIRRIFDQYRDDLQGYDDACEAYKKESRTNNVIYKQNQAQYDLLFDKLISSNRFTVVENNNKVNDDRTKKMAIQKIQNNQTELYDAFDLLQSEDPDTRFTGYSKWKVAIEDTKNSLNVVDHRGKKLFSDEEVSKTHRKIQEDLFKTVATYGYEQFDPLDEEQNLAKLRYLESISTENIARGMNSMVSTSEGEVSLGVKFDALDEDTVTHLKDKLRTRYKQDLWRQKQYNEGKLLDTLSDNNSLTQTSLMTHGNVLEDKYEELCNNGFPSLSEGVHTSGVNEATEGFLKKYGYAPKSMLGRISSLLESGNTGLFVNACCASHYLKEHRPYIPSDVEDYNSIAMGMYGYKLISQGVSPEEAQAKIRKLVEDGKKLKMPSDDTIDTNEQMIA